MGRTVYLNGEFIPEEKAKISVFDRGFLFADGVYEVSAVLNGTLIDNHYHLQRLGRSLNELNMSSPLENKEIEAIQLELIKRNKLEEGLVYLQITRGATDRDFSYPKEIRPSILLFTQVKNILNNKMARQGMTVITSPDLRWARRDIKTISLLAASMAKMEAIKSGADDVWLVDQNGLITEGSSSNTYIVTEEGVITRHLSNDILAGITRRAILHLAETQNVKIIERAFTATEAKQAREAFATSAGMFVIPVVKIDDKRVGLGRPGKTTRSLQQLYIEMALQQSSIK